MARDKIKSKRHFYNLLAILGSLISFFGIALIIVGNYQAGDVTDDLAWWFRNIIGPGFLFLGGALAVVFGKVGDLLAEVDGPNANDVNNDNDANKGGP